MKNKYKNINNIAQHILLVARNKNIQKSKQKSNQPFPFSLFKTFSKAFHKCSSAKKKN